MPIFVDEVVITLEVGKEAPASAGAADASGSAEDKQAVIRECVEAVLQILAQREER